MMADPAKREARQRYRREWNDKNRDKKRASSLASYHRLKEDPEWLAKKDAAAKEWKKNNPGKVKEAELRSKLKRLYGMDLEDYLVLLKLQGGVCAICKKPETIKTGETTWALSVDHDHESGAIRGLLCISCNQGVGRFGDDPKMLERAAAYLREHQGQ